MYFCSTDANFFLNIQSHWTACLLSQPSDDVYWFCVCVVTVHVCMCVCMCLYVYGVAGVEQLRKKMCRWCSCCFATTTAADTKKSDEMFQRSTCQHDGKYRAMFISKEMRCPAWYQHWDRSTTHFAAVLDASALLLLLLMKLHSYCYCCITSLIYYDDMEQSDILTLH